MSENRVSTVNALVVANTGLSACRLFRQELLVCHVNRKREKDMLKQQDMTEAARVVFNELSVTDPATVREIAQNTYLSRERCQLILTQLVMAGLADWLLQTPSVLKAFLFVVNGRLVGVVVVAFPLLKKKTPDC